MPQGALASGVPAWLHDSPSGATSRAPTLKSRHTARTLRRSACHRLLRGCGSACILFIEGAYTQSPDTKGEPEKSSGHLKVQGTRSKKCKGHDQKSNGCVWSGTRGSDAMNDGARMATEGVEIEQVWSVHRHETLQFLRPGSKISAPHAGSTRYPRLRSSRIIFAVRARRRSRVTAGPRSSYATPSCRIFQMSRQRR